MKTRTSIPFLVISCGIAIGLGTGVGLRKFFAAAANLTDRSGIAVDTTDAARSQSGKKLGRVGRDDDSPLATKLSHDLSISSGVTRWLHWWDAVEKAVPSDFPRFARIAEGDSAAMRLVAERWVELAPREFFNTLVSASKTGNKFTNEWGTILLEEWTKRDSNALVAALNESEDFSKRKQWRQQVANSFLDKEPERGLHLMADRRLSASLSNTPGIRTSP